jgi:hypothetical protein
MRIRSWLSVADRMAEGRSNRMKTGRHKGNPNPLAFHHDVAASLLSPPLLPFLLPRIPSTVAVGRHDPPPSTVGSSAGPLVGGRVQLGRARYLVGGASGMVARGAPPGCTRASTTIHVVYIWVKQPDREVSSACFAWRNSCHARLIDEASYLTQLRVRVR